MLTVQYYDEEGNKKEFIWHHGMPIPKDLFPSIDRVFAVHANGEDRHKIHWATYCTLPRMWGNGKHWEDNPEFVERWYGDHAKFIVGNILLPYVVDEEAIAIQQRNFTGA